MVPTFLDSQIFQYLFVLVVTRASHVILLHLGSCVTDVTHTGITKAMPPSPSLPIYRNPAMSLIPQHANSCDLRVGLSLGLETEWPRSG